MRQNKDKLTKAFFTMEILILLAIAFIATNTYATISCAPSASCSDTAILYVKNDTGGYENAHAQNVSIGTYAYSICCNADSIGETVGTGCSDFGAATFLRLADTTNSHVEVPSLSNYANTACISVTNRILACNNYSGSCPAQTYCIASIASSELADNNLTNAHVDASCSEYDMKICCSYSNSPPIMNTTRTSPDGTVFTHQTLAGYCNATDADGGNIYYHYVWFKNDSNDNSGTTGATTEGIEYNVDDLTSGETAKNELWILGCLADDGTFNSSWMNSSTVSVINTPPEKISLDYPNEDDQTFINRTPRFNWTQGSDNDTDSITYQIEVSTYYNFSDSIENQTGLGNNYFDASNELAFNTYFWRVRATDGETYGDWSDIWNFTLVEYISVDLQTTTISWGGYQPGSSNDTTDDNPAPFDFISSSNTYADLWNTTANETLWDNAALDTEYWKIKARSTGSDGTFNETGSNTSWINVSSYQQDVIKYLNYSHGKRNVDVDVEVTVPFAEPVGDKTGYLTFVWEAS